MFRLVSLILISFNLFSQTEYTQNVNNINIKWGNQGIPVGGSGTHNGTPFLYSYGFGVSGYVEDSLRASWQFSASRSMDFRPGKINEENDNSSIWVVHQDDTHGSQAYSDWVNAVDHGAKYLDVNNNGIYEPSIDHPQKLGTETFYMLVNDDVSPEYRYFGKKPLNVEIGVTGFASLEGGRINDAVFVEYTITNTSDTVIKDMIFSSLLDPDVGVDFSDDLVGCDTVFTFGNDVIDDFVFAYNEDINEHFAAGLDMVRGPSVQGNANDTVTEYNGNLGVKKVGNFKSSEINSMVVIDYNSHDRTFRPETVYEARRVMEGRTTIGSFIDPTLYGSGGQLTDNPRIMFPGDPVTSAGWIRNYYGIDARFYFSSHTFDLEPGESNSVVMSWFAAKGISNLDGITELRKTDLEITAFYTSNYKSEPTEKLLPTIEEIPDLSIRNRESFEYKLVFTGLPQPKFTLINEPDGMTVAKNGYLRWTPKNLDLGEFKITIIAENSVGSVTKDFVLHVKEPTFGFGRVESGSVRLYGDFPYSRYRGDKEKLFGKYELRWVADTSDYEHQTVVLGNDTIFNGKAYINPSTGKPVYAIHNKGAKKQLISPQYEVWHLGEDEGNSSDDIQVWVALGYNLGTLGNRNLYSLLDHINYPESIYDSENISNVFTGIRADLENYWKFLPEGPERRPDWLIRYSFDDENYPDGASGKVGEKSVISFDNPYIFPIDDQETLSETLFRYKVYASSDTTMSYSLTQKPETMTIDSSGYINWIPKNKDVGEHTIEVQVANHSRATKKTFKLNVVQKIESEFTSELFSIGVNNKNERLNLAVYSNEQIEKPLARVKKGNSTQLLEATPILQDHKSFSFNYSVNESGELKFNFMIEDIHENMMYDSLTIHSLIIEKGEVSESLDSELKFVVPNGAFNDKTYFYSTKKAEWSYTQDSEGNNLDKVSKVYSFTSDKDFIKPLQIHFDLDISDYDSKGEVALYKFNSKNKHWQHVKGFYKKIEPLEITSYGTYALFYNENRTRVPTEFIVSQNYPNPFNPSTTIEFGLPKEAKTTITIFNVLGQKTKTLVNKFLDAGAHKYIWDGTNRYGQRVASGVYFYQVRNNVKQITKKMVLIK